MYEFLVSRRSAILGGVCSALTLAAAPAFANGPEIGAPAPRISAIGADGEAVDTDALRGKTVVLEWTNHDCPFVMKHYGAGNMQATQAAAEAAGAVWLQVISSAPGTQGYVDDIEALALNDDRDATVANVVLDPSGEIGRAYQAKVTPHMYVIDPDGRLAYMGGIDSIATANPADIPKATNYVQAAVEAVAKGETPEVQTSRAYGCSVKYAG